VLAEYGLKNSLTAVIKRAGRAEKIITLLLLFILLTAATAGVTAVLTGPDWALLWESLLLGMLIGWVLAIFRSPVWRSAFLAIGLGLLFSLLFASRLDVKVQAIFGELLGLTGHIITTLSTKGVDLSPLNSLTMHVFTSTGVVLGRVYSWLKDLVIGQPRFDPVAAGFVWSIVVWLVAAWAGWVVEASRNALMAVLPAILLNLSTLSYGQNNSASIYLILGITLVLVSVVQYDQREQEWSESRVAYPTRKSREVGNTSLIIATVLVVLAASISSLSLQRIIHWTSTTSRSSGQSENGLAKSLGIVAAVTATPDAFTTIRNPGLPRDLLIGSGPELSTELVMSVEVKDLTSLLQAGQLPPLYWRSFTYDIYTGHGWSSSATEQSQYQAGQPIQPDHLSDHILIQQVMRPVSGAGGTIYAAGEPVSISITSSAARRSYNDLFGIQTGNNGYEIQSLIPVVDEISLREAGQAYPDWIVQRYLALPAEVTPRVKALAIQLTATEPTPYDRARAIEQYLRRFPYTLDVPRPPANQDLADFFLFDLRKGYCDYYASAMVVLARAAGIPTRLAIGYASGMYNLNSKRFIVTQADAHSWVEVYFPGMGWVPFEPTAGLPPINRSGQPTQEVTPLPTTSIVPPGGSGFSNPGKYIGNAIVVLIVASSFLWAILDEIQLRRLKPRPAAREIYRRMKRYGALLSVQAEGGETPYEFASSLDARILEITQQGSAAAIGLTTVSNAQSLIGKLVRLSYRPSDTEAMPASGILDQWKSLRWRLRLLWILRIWESLRHQIREGFAGQSEKRHTLVE
jgi:transglutaminase-like putative cysteine protease